MRQQNAAVNLSLTQGFLFEPSFDDTKLMTADSIYANFIHGCRGHGSDFSIYGFMRIAIPCAVNPTNAEDAQRMLKFVESHSLYKVLAAVVEMEVETKAAPTVRVATPKLKKVK